MISLDKFRVYFDKCFINKKYFILKENMDFVSLDDFVSALSLYYRYYHGRYSDELKSKIPPKACFARSTRFADSQHFRGQIRKVPDHFIR